jgi:hypothetical protein
LKQLLGPVAHGRFHLPGICREHATMENGKSRLTGETGFYSAE